MGLGRQNGRLGPVRLTQNGPGSDSVFEAASATRWRLFCVRKAERGSLCLPESLRGSVRPRLQRARRAGKRLGRRAVQVDVKAARKLQTDRLGLRGVTR
jgi:hypothetical protein